MGFKNRASMNSVNVWPFGIIFLNREPTKIKAKSAPELPRLYPIRAVTPATTPVSAGEKSIHAPIPVATKLSIEIPSGRELLAVMNPSTVIFLLLEYHRPMAADINAVTIIKINPSCIIFLYLLSFQRIFLLFHKYFQNSLSLI